MANAIKTSFCLASFCTKGLVDSIGDDSTDSISWMTFSKSPPHGGLFGFCDCSRSMCATNLFNSSFMTYAPRSMALYLATDCHDCPANERGLIQIHSLSRFVKDFFEPVVTAENFYSLFWLHLITPIDLYKGIYTKRFLLPIRSNPMAFMQRPVSVSVYTSRQC